MHEYEQVLRDRTTSGEKPDGPSRVKASANSIRASRQVGRLHARENRTSEDLNASHARPDSLCLGIEATAVWSVRKKQKRREHGVVLRLDRAYKQWVMSSVVITF